MLCSKCKVFSIHLKNYDSFICEYGHVLCRSCSAQSNDRSRCGICNGQIIRRTEFFLEGIPKTIFRDPFQKGEDPRQHNDDDENKGNSGYVQLVESDDDLDRFDAVDDERVAGGDTCENYGHDFKIPRASFEKRPGHEVNFPTETPRKCLWKHDYEASDLDSSDQESSDSSTLIQHLSEFRKATNYSPPAVVTVYKVAKSKSLTSQAILTKSPTKYKNKVQVNSFPKAPTNSIGIQTSNEIKSHSSTTEEMNVLIPTSKTPCETLCPPSKIASNSNLKFQSNLTICLRRKLLEQIYSQFDDEKPKLKNEFMVKGNMEAIPPQILFYDATGAEKENFVADSISAEIEKVLKNSFYSCVSFRGNLRREEMIRRSKWLLRQKILQEVYSPFENDCNPDLLSKYPFENQNNSKEGIIDLTQDQSQELNKQEDDKPIAETINMKKQQLSEESSRMAATSTESYPKLATQYSAMNEAKSTPMKSQSSSEEPYVHELSMFMMSETSPIEIDSKNFLEEEESWPERSNAHTMGAKSLEKLMEVKTLVEPIKILPSSHHIFPIKKSDVSIAIVKEPLSDIPETSSELEQAPEAMKPGGNVFYFCQTETDFKSQDDISSSLINNRAVPKHLAQAGDYFEMPGGDTRNINDINCLVRYMQRQFPNLRLKDLKNVIMNLPSEDDLKKNTENEYSDTEGTKLQSDPFDFSFDNRKGFDSVNEHRISAQNFLKQINIIASRAHFPLIFDAFAMQPQYETLAASNNNSTAKASKHVRRAADLNIPRSPIICPISSCSRLVFVSEFARHIKMDHDKIPVESMAPGTHKNIFLDPKIGHYGVNKCRAMYLVTDKVKDLGSREFKNYLPVLLMSTKICLSELIRPAMKCRKRSIKNSDISLMLWLTGLSLSDLPIYYTLIAWSRKPHVPLCHIVHSGKIYSIRNNQDYRSVFRSGQFLLLKFEQWMLLSGDGNNLMELQVVIH